MFQGKNFSEGGASVAQRQTSGGQRVRWTSLHRRSTLVWKHTPIRFWRLYYTCHLYGIKLNSIQERWVRHFQISRISIQICLWVFFRFVCEYPFRFVCGCSSGRPSQSCRSWASELGGKKGKYFLSCHYLSLFVSRCFHFCPFVSTGNPSGLQKVVPHFLCKKCVTHGPINPNSLFHFQILSTYLLFWKMQFWKIQFWKI